MFLLNYFYGTKTQPCEQGIKPEEDWVLVDNNEPTVLTTSLDDYGVLEKDELLSSSDDGITDQLNPEPISQASQSQRAINQTETYQSQQIGTAPQTEEQEPQRLNIEPLVQNPGARIGQHGLKPRTVVPVTPNNASAAALLIKGSDTLTTALTNKVKNNCKKQAQRRADKYKSGIWSGRSNDRKCGKCY